jgi:hypothetical protein
LRYGYGERSANGAVGVGNPTHELQGMYLSLLKGRFLFDFVHEEGLQPENLAGYSALILPNVATLSETQCDQLRSFVNNGGSIFANFETSLYDEWGSRRGDFGLSDVLGANVSGDGSREGRVFYSKIQKKHEVLAGIDSETWLPGGEWRVPLKACPNALLTAVPHFPQGIPEMVYPHARKELAYPSSKSSEPSLVLRETGESRLAYYSGDIGRCVWVYGSTDLVKLVRGVTSWICRDSQPVSILGKGLIEFFAWQTSVGYAVHILNYQTPHFARSDIDEVSPIGPQRVTFELPDGAQVDSVKLLVAGSSVEYIRKDDTISFEIPRIERYEVAAVCCV